VPWVRSAGASVPNATVLRGDLAMRFANASRLREHYVEEIVGTLTDVSRRYEQFGHATTFVSGQHVSDTRQPKLRSVNAQDFSIWNIGTSDSPPLLLPSSRAFPPLTWTAGESRAVFF